MINNAYIVLGVMPGITDEELREAYLALAKTNHPDHGGDHAKFSEITAAYSLIRTPELRRRHDMALAILNRNCPACEGKGFIERTKGFTFKERINCRVCGGSGENTPK